MAKNIQNVRFLRNNGLLDSREAAISALNGYDIKAAQDGTIILARYGSGNDVKTLAGLVYANGDNKSITIIDVEGGSEEVEKLRQEINAKLGGGVTSANTATAQLEALSGGTFVPGTSSSANTSVEGAKAYAYDLVGTLDYGDTAVTGQYVSQVTQSDGKIAVTRVALPSVDAISESGKAITAVSESNGQISATAGTINAEYVNVTGDTFTAETVQGALEEIDAEYKAAIEDLDYTDTAVTGSYVSEVNETNGVISVNRIELPSSADTAVAKKVVIAVSEDKGQINVSRGEITSSAGTIVLTDNTDGGVNFEVNIDNDTIVQDETSKKLKVASAALTQYVGDENTIHISSADTNNNKTVSSLLTIKKVTDGLPSEVKEEYYLVGEDEITIGSPVTIYKDSHIVSITYITDSTDPHYQNLEYVYIDASGATKNEYVDISGLVLEAEFASGVTVTDHIAHGVVDPTSESFLTVGADGFKLDGVQDAIDAAVNALDVTGDTAQSGKYITHINEENGLISIGGRADISKAPLNDYSKGSDSGAVIATDSINQAISKLENQIDGKVAGLDADVSGNSTHVSVGVVEENGVISAVTVAEDNIADADDLATLSAKTITDIDSANGSITVTPANAADGTKEIDLATDASKIKMSGFSADASGFTAITEASTVTEAVKAIETEIIANEQTVAASLTDLDGRLDIIESGYVETVKVNDVALTETNNAVNVQISASTSAGTASNGEAIVVTTDRSTGAITLALDYADCGYYDEV